MSNAEQRIEELTETLEDAEVELNECDFGSPTYNFLTRMIAKTEKEIEGLS